MGRELLKPGILGKLGVLDKRAMKAGAETAFKDLGVAVKDADAAVAYLSGGQRQGVAVARAASWASRVIIMDEPTAALGVVQTENVLNVIRRVRDSGVAVVLISHNMPDVLKVADRIEVLRLGRRVAVFRRERGDARVARRGNDRRRRPGGSAVSSGISDPTKAPEPGRRAVTPPSESRAAKLWRAATSTSGSLPIFLALILIVVVFSIMKPSAFLGSYNIKSIFIDASVALTLSVGMTYVIITAGIDLSVGSVLVFSGVIALKVMAALAGGLHGVDQCGLGHHPRRHRRRARGRPRLGSVERRADRAAGLPPLIVTLGTFGAALGLADVLTGGVDLSGVPNKLANDDRGRQGRSDSRAGADRGHRGDRASG